MCSKAQTANTMYIQTTVNMFHMFIYIKYCVLVHSNVLRLAAKQISESISVDFTNICLFTLNFFYQHLLMTPAYRRIFFYIQPKYFLYSAKPQIRCSFVIQTFSEILFQCLKCKIVAKGNAIMPQRLSQQKMSDFKIFFL